MKKHLLLFTFFLISTISYSQNFYKVGDRLMNESDFFSDLKTNKKEQAPRYLSPKVYEEVSRNDSLIRNIRPIVYKDKTSAQKAYYLLLNKSFPDFKFQGINNNWYAKSRFLGKPTVVCFFYSKFQPTRKEIKKLNALNKNENYHVVAFLGKENTNKSTYSRMDFPVLKNASTWLNLNFPGHHFPQYMLFDENGILTYLFPEFPNKKTTYTPISEQTKEIFNYLAN